ncbi:alpha/beta fold hydrolase [Mycobacterium sp. JS623]|uniref:alpha/beta fold hydrolase n=1 Tax=Mycobacterium sp. JS623 TaxID=212767 RepID=UPI000A0447C6
MDFSTDKGGGLYFEERGQGVPVLLVHPAGATASTWGGVADDLAKHGRVIAYDRRGYRRSGGAPANSIPMHTSDAAALLDRLQCPPAVVVGTSIGATIAIDLALRRPDLVRAVVAHESPWHVTRHPPTHRRSARSPRWDGWRRDASMRARLKHFSASPTPTATVARRGTSSLRSGDAQSGRTPKPRLWISAPLSATIQGRRTWRP